MAKKIIIDTDIGDDIDDAEAIVLALRSPEVEIVGITTVFKNVAARARITERLLELGGAPQIPVYCGCGQPMMFRVDEEEIPPQYGEELDTIEIDRNEHAVDYIIRTVMASPGEITLVPIGALTNVALAILREPVVKKAVKEIVWMGGAFYYHFRTWNAVCDPDAVRVVFESGAPLRVVSRDVSLKCVLSPEQVDALRKPQDPAVRYLAELTDRWHGAAKRQPILFDPLTIAAIFDDRFLKFKPEYVGVETKGEFTRGLTFLYNSRYTKLGLPADKDVFARDPIQIAYDVDGPGFVSFFIDRLSS
jgi:purine nucleosidase/pyrimidine-specific ribonucleoside hydrolase